MELKTVKGKYSPAEPVGIFFIKSCMAFTNKAESDIINVKEKNYVGKNKSRRKFKGVSISIS